MLKSDQPLAIFMEHTLGDSHGKMGYGILRFSPNPVVCVVDSVHAGKSVCDVVPSPRNCPVVATIREAAALGAEALVLGIAPSGGRLPTPWLRRIDNAVASGLSIVNGLHDRLAERYGDLRPGQWIWDIRREPEGLGVGKGRARALKNRRVVVVGTDMATGKMSAGLAVWQLARKHGIAAEFVATGQIGIVITGRGIPLDAVRVDYACGAVEKMVMETADAELIIVEGQGSILHPGSTATLPLLRGACPTHLLLCHWAGHTTLRDFSGLPLPPLGKVAALYEAVATGCGLFPPARVAAISLNTVELDQAEARRAVAETEAATGLPATDPLRFGAAKLLHALFKD
ncbi:MAG: DUF1611 domain-containing protein [Kiritimatiellaeota bacterium]|nr:DUF1611 domain-containing protein [Kiritimatiellota bacterium]